MNPKHVKKFLTKDLYLSPIDIENDAEYFYRWMNEDRDIVKFNGFLNFLLTYDQVVERLKKWDEDGISLVALEKETDRVVGHAAIFGIEKISRNCEIGIFIQEESRGKGYARQIMEALLKHAFENLNMHVVLIKVFSENKKAISLYESIGFKQSGVMREVCFMDGKYTDLLYMSILDREYFNREN